MRAFILLIFCSALFAFTVNAQDSLLRSASYKTDSVVKFSNQKVDSVHKQFVHRTDSLQKAYATPMKDLHSKINYLNHKKDSLNRLRLPTQSVTHKIDSLENAQTAKLRELNNKIEKVKKETLAEVSALHLPPEAQNEINALTKNIHGFSVPNNFFLLKAFGMPNLNFKIPGMSSSFLSIPSNLAIPSANIPSMQKLNLSMATLPSLSKMQGSLANGIKQAQSASNLQALEKTITADLAQNAEAKLLLKQEAQGMAMENKITKLKSAKSSDSLARQELIPQINHFIGKEKELQSAMGQITKYKQKYTSLAGLDKIPKRVPNALKGKPWIERVVPGLNYFIQSRHYTMVDFNPYIGWRFNPKLTASIGWNERIGIVKGSFHTDLYDRVYGVRGSVSYLWAHGFIFRLSPEVMNAYVPVGNTTDSKQQTLVWGLFGGVRKDFKLYKSLIGYTEGAYNFIQKPGRNIYGDQLSFRLGIEVMIKKKAAKAKEDKPQSKDPGTSAVKPLSLKDSFNIVKSHNLFGAVGIKGDTLVKAQYKSVSKFLLGKKLYFIVGLNGKFGAMTSKGTTSVPISHTSRRGVKFEIINKESGKLGVKNLTGGITPKH